MEAQMAKWTHISLENQFWRIPATSSKSKRVRSVPLNGIALDALNANQSDHEYVFINHRTDKPYSNIHKSWYRIRNKAGLPHLRAHDLRHSFASIIANSGESLFTLQILLGHSTPLMSQRYAHLKPDHLLQASNAASDAIQAAMDKAATNAGQQ